MNAIYQNQENIFKNAFDQLSLEFKVENTYQRDDYNVAQRDWHYRIHALTVEANENYRNR